MIQEKFNYVPIQRIDGENQRLYETPAGDRVPSVTTILSATKDDSGLKEWRNRVGHAKATEITVTAGNRGTRLHKYIERYIEEGEWPEPGSNPYAKQANSMAKLIFDNGMKNLTAIYGSEVKLYFPQIYAGTTDLVADYLGNLSICDFKQSNKLKKEEWVLDYKLQIVSYAEAHNEVSGTNIREGHIFMSTQNLEYQQFDVWPDEYDFYKKQWWERCEQYYIK